MKKFFPLLLTLVALGMISGCTTEPKGEEAKGDLTENANMTLKRMERQDPGLGDFLNRAYGYVIFPSVGKGAVGVGGAYGHGEVYEHGNFIGYATLTQASIGVQLGGQEYSELVVFESRDSLDRFTQGNFTFAANASAVAVTQGASASAPYRNGVAVFTMAKGGLMFEASIGGQKFNFKRSNNQGDNNTGARTDMRSGNNQDNNRTDTDVNAHGNINANSRGIEAGANVNRNDTNGR
jgi:lipid-binding SYLF domain-containing protein